MLAAPDLSPSSFVSLALTEHARATAELQAKSSDAPSPGQAVLQAGSTLRILGDAALDDTALWQPLGPATRARAFAHAASARRAAVSRWRGAPPSPRLATEVLTTLDALPQPLVSLPELPLALWSGRELALGGPGQLTLAQDTLDYTIQWGAPAPGPIVEGARSRLCAAAEALAVATLGPADVSTEALRCTIVKCYADAPGAALEVARHIGMPALALHSLFELATAVRLEAAATTAAVDLAAALRDAGLAARTAATGLELWPGAADVHLAGILAATAGAGATPELEAASICLARGLEPLATPLPMEARVRLYRLGLVAAALIGVPTWSDLVERMLADRQLLRDPYERAGLVFETAATTAHVTEPARRSEAIGRVADVVYRTPDPALKALVLAELAARTRGLPDRGPATYFGEARKALLARGADAPFLAQTFRALAAADLGPALELARALPRPADRALATLVVAEAAAGITEG